MISVSFYCTIISLSKILGYTDLIGVCVVCVRGSQLLSLIILELEYFGGRCSAKYVKNQNSLHHTLLKQQISTTLPFTSSKILLSAFLMKKNLLFLAPKIHKSTFFRLKFYFFWPLKSTNLLFF